MKLTITAYDADSRTFTLFDGVKTYEYADILIDGPLPASEEYQSCKTITEARSFEKTLVGKQIEVDKMNKYELTVDTNCQYIPSNVRLLN